MNVIGSDGDEIKSFGYLSDTFLKLERELKDFDKYTFVIFGNNNTKKPISRLFKHPNKILIWCSNENKTINYKSLKDDFVHIFANYHWDSEGITSIPLGWHTESDMSDIVPMNERLFNISFTGCLNRNRFDIASELSGIPKRFIGFGMAFMKKFTLKVLNTIVKYKYNTDWYKFNSDFNNGLDTDTYHWILRHTKIALVPKGWVNSETFRLYEAMRYGCVIICEELPDREYYKGIPAIIVQNWNDGIDIANELLSNPDMLNHLSNESKRFYEEKLSGNALADIILKELNNK